MDREDDQDQGELDGSRTPSRSCAGTQVRRPGCPSRVSFSLIGLDEGKLNDV